MNTGHGHVTPRGDGVRARCGGPALCPECAAELAQKSLGVPPADGALPRMSGVSGYLVTGRFPHLEEFIISTNHYANWVEVRPTRPEMGDASDTTAQAMVMDKDAPEFVATARRLNELPRLDRVRTLTVEKITGAGDGESYDLLTGEPGTGWARSG